MKRLYAIRGAVCAKNSEKSVSEATVSMCSEIFARNGIRSEDIVSMHFTLTKDLYRANPCAMLRRNYKGIDVSKVPLFCSQEAYIRGGLKKVIRLLLSVYMEEGSVPENVYLGGAEVLRPDFCKK